MDRAAAGTIGYWKCRVPIETDEKVYLAPASVLLGLFCALGSGTAAAPTAYVMGLFLVRKRLLRIEVNDQPPDHPETLNLYSPRLNQSFEIPVFELTREAIQAIQSELESQLFSSEPIEDLNATDDVSDDATSQE